MILRIFLYAIGIYSLITLPLLLSPLIYAMSIFIVITFGWLAFAVFGLGYLLAINFCKKFIYFRILLFILVIVAVLTSYETYCITEKYEFINEFSFFPLLAILAGFISVYLFRKELTDNYNLYHSNNL